MTPRPHESTGPAGSEIDRLAARVARSGIELDPASALQIAQLGHSAATRKADGVCRLVRAARNECIQLTFRRAMWRLDACGGDVEEAIRRMLAGGLEFREGVPETVQYAADRGLSLAPTSVYDLFKRYGRAGARRYIDKLGKVMDAASILGVSCPQSRATHRLAATRGDAQAVIAGFAAQQRRRADKSDGPCRVLVPPRALEARSNAFASCGCPFCRERLAAQMQRYIAKMIAAPYFGGLDREEARAEANLQLMRSIDSFPGGNFTGWFAAGFKDRAAAMYQTRSIDEQHTVSLDAPSVLAYDDDGRTVPLEERIPDRTVDTVEIVLLRERVAEAELQLRQERADRAKRPELGETVDPVVPLQPSCERPHLIQPTAENSGYPQGLGRAAA